MRELAGTPAYVYDMATLKANAQATLAFPNAFGLTVRYAMKVGHSLFPPSVGGFTNRLGGLSG